MNLLYLPNLFELSPLLMLLALLVSGALLALPLYASPGRTDARGDPHRRAPHAGPHRHPTVAPPPATRRC